MVDLRSASSKDLPRILSFYSRVHYGQSVSEEDLLFLAEENGRIVGAVRLPKEGGVRVLRGMRVAKDHQRRGIARKLLFRAANAVQGETCYCIPHRYLASFYQEAGFLEIEESIAPPFLVERLASYRSDLGLDVVLMRRQPQQPPRPSQAGQPPNNSMEPTRPARCLAWRPGLELGWPGGSSRGR